MDCVSDQLHALIYLIITVLIKLIFTFKVWFYIFVTIKTDAEVYLPIK